MKDRTCHVSRADPGFFLGGGALVSCSTSTPINHIVFSFFCRIPVVLENGRSSQGGAHPLHPPPRSAPAYTAISRKVVGQNVHATIPKGNMGYDQYTVPDTVAQSNLLLFLFLAPTNIRPWPLVSFFQTSLNESAFKTTHDTVRDCRVHFFRQSFSKYLYMGQLTGHLV